MKTILHTESSLGWGGQEIRIIQEASGLRNRGYRILIAAEKNSVILKKAIQEGFEAFPVSFIKFKPSSFWKIKSLIEKENVNIVNTHSSKDSWVSIIAAKLASNKPKIIRTRHLSTPIKNNALNRLIYNILPDAIITTGDEIRKHMINDNKFNPDKIFSIPTGVDLEKFNPEKVKPLFTNKEFKVGTIGVLRSWKGHIYLLEAIPLILNHISNIKFYIVGDGPQRENIKNNIKQLNIEKWVIMTGYREDIPEILASLDVIVHPSYANEGVPQAVIQAMAMKKTVIATDTGSIKEILIDKFSGLLIEPKNKEQIAEAVISLYKDNQLRSFLGENAQRLVKDNYSFDKMLEKIENVYQKIFHK
ncbi:Glycosyltransferase [Thermodesulfovibrio sp. N1]|uniref:glycosyltransferase family 4 protein n=1 Tax=Thermodesulfovibrio sp. N1 TaxID=1871110 RepID=UPI00083B8AC3|nr:glycosyltransferase family 4 protein [Thermodesulfovibrio sp. N1]ODA43515.1 Glycosyltransferase [Thermodesulfovibrio sp. N1]